jgi:hypothetical protein
VTVRLESKHSSFTWGGFPLSHIWNSRYRNSFFPTSCREVLDETLVELDVVALVAELLAVILFVAMSDLQLFVGHIHTDGTTFLSYTHKEGK